jgi:hypothetical protein
MTNDSQLTFWKIIAFRGLNGPLNKMVFYDYNNVPLQGYWIGILLSLSNIIVK